MPGVPHNTALCGVPATDGQSGRLPPLRSEVSTRYPTLFSEGRIGSLQLRNRILLTAMGVNFGDGQGYVTDAMRQFCANVAQGGAAMVNLGVVGVGWPVGANIPRQIALSDDRFIPGIRSVADAVHEHRAKLVVQLHFGGLVAVEDMLKGGPAWTPSIPQSHAGDMLEAFLPEELEEAPFARLVPQYKVLQRQDIAQVVGMFGAAAERAVRAGADGVEIHGGHGYLISSFLSPFTNRRDDEYGGSAEKRARLLIEIIAAIRARVGAQFPVWCKIDSQEFALEGGITLKDARITARLAERAGASAITVTAYHDASIGALHSASHTPDVPELLMENVAAIKAAVGIPVIGAGRIEPEAAERHLRARRCDFIAMGRKLLADPGLPNKLREGRERDVRPCIYCYTCISQIYLWRPTHCAVHPDLAVPAAAPGLAVAAKRVVIIGAGPAGLEAARRLALRGHQVTVLERSDRVGGTLAVAAVVYEPNAGLLAWLAREIAAGGTRVLLRTEATPQRVLSLQPDEVVVAAGALRLLPAIPGAEASYVLGGEDLRRLLLGEQLEQLSAKTGWSTRMAARLGAATGLNRSPALIRAATRAWMPLGDRIVIVGGELVGLELAHFLAERGRKVSVVEDGGRLGAGVPIVRRWRLLGQLKALDVAIFAKAREVRIRDHHVHCTDNGQSLALPADHVIVARGASTNLALANELRGLGLRVHAIGDCTGVGYIDGAMHAAAQLAASL